MRSVISASGTAAVTPWFSSDSSEQVEYTRTPPGESAPRVGKQRRLADAQVVEIVRLEPPLDFRIAAQGPGTRAGGVHQNTVEGAREGKRTGAVEHHQVGGQRLE